MKYQDEDLIYKYWKKFVNTTSKPVKDWLEKENEFLKNNIQKNSTLLDVGVGYGRNLSTIVNICKKVVGIDNSKFMLEELKEAAKQYSNVEFFCEDARKTHFQNSTFDYVICLGNTFGDFAENKSTILNDMKRVCKKDGKIFISVYSENALPCRIREYKRIGIKISKIHNGKFYTEDGLVLEQFTKSDLEQLFNNTGLEVEILELNNISYMCVAKK